MPPKPSKSKPHRSETPAKSTKKPEQPTPSYAGAADADSIRKSGRKRKVRYADSFASLSSAHRQWTDEDTLLILNGAVDFKSKTGTTPTPTLIGEFFDSIKGSLSSAEITPEMVLNRLRRLRRKFNEMPPDGLPATDHDRIVYELSAKAWGTSAATDEEGGKEQEIESEKEGHDDDDDDDDDGDDEGGDYPYLTRGVKEYAKMFGGGFPVEILDVLDPAKKRELEEKYKRLSKVDMKFRRNRCILNKELYDALFAGEAKEG